MKKTLASFTVVLLLIFALFTLPCLAASNDSKPRVIQIEDNGPRIVVNKISAWSNLYTIAGDWEFYIYLVGGNSISVSLGEDEAKATTLYNRIDKYLRTKAFKTKKFKFSEQP